VNLIWHLKELWHRRVLVALAVLGAAAVAVLVVFQVSLFPPSVSKRAQIEAHGSIEILVDAADSPIADSRRDLSGLTARAGVFARYIAGGNVVRLVATANGISPRQIDVSGATPLPGEAPGAELESPQLHPYGISVGQAGELPILSVSTRAPTVREARDLAAAVPVAVRQVVRSVQNQQGTQPRKRVQFRVLGPAQAALVDDALGKKMALAIFVVLLALSLATILVLPRLAAAWRAAGPVPDRWQGDHESESEVLLLPPGRRELGQSGSEATRISGGEP